MIYKLLFCVVVSMVFFNLMKFSVKKRINTFVVFLNISFYLCEHL